MGIMGALALVLSFCENMLIPDIPFLPPGAKPGLANIVTMLVASVSGFTGAMCITLTKAIFALITRGVTDSFLHESLWWHLKHRGNLYIYKAGGEDFLLSWHRNNRCYHAQFRSAYWGCYYFWYYRDIHLW